MSASTGAVAGPATANQRGLLALGSVTSKLEKHPWAVAFSVAVYVAVKVLRVANGDLGTAQLILRNDGLAGLTTLVLMIAIPTAILMAFISALLSIGAIIEAKAWPQLTGALSVFGVTLVVAVLIVPWDTFWVFGLIGGGLAVVMGFLLRKWPLQDPIGSYGWPEFVWLAAVGGVIGLGSTLFSGAMWTPAERIRVADSPAVIVGYVLANDGDQMLILREGDRGTASYPVDEILERQRCQLADAPRPLFPLDPVEYVACND